MRIKLFLGIIIIALLVTFVINQDQIPANPPASNQTPPTAQPPTAPKTDVQVAPDFTLTNLNGEEVSLSDYRGQNVYLNFWASWCPPCRAEMPDMEEIHQEYQDKGLVVLTVNLAESKDTVQKFITANDFTFPVLLDPKNEAAKLYKITSIPVSVFINKDGVIAEKRVGMLTKKQMEELIQSLPE